LQHFVQRNRREVRSEEEQPGELGTHRPGSEIEGAYVGHSSRRGSSSVWTLVISSSRQPREAFLFEEQGDGCRAELVPRVLKDLVDVVDGQVLLAQSDDLLSEAIFLGSRAGPLLGGEEKGSARVLAELVAENAEASWGVAEALSDEVRR
jgi:hypothetical protein